ncbi:hypothetical protein HKCCE4037_14740 [Rhodobacterales bacterium HKCCE4037]|nr:hypothetical protein [Rhodobacterales bacterium HKCCE4037]
MRPLLPTARTLSSDLPAADACVARAERVIARMQAGGRVTSDPSNWRPAQSPWR